MNIFNSKRLFGIEIEMTKKVTKAKIKKIINDIEPGSMVSISNHYNNENNNIHWAIKWDGSCKGWEVASRVSSGYKDVLLMGVLGEKLKESGVEVTDKCAFHVHVNVGDMKVVQVANLVAWWMKMEGIVLQMVPAYRRKSVYCVPLNEHYKITKFPHTPELFWNRIRPNTLNFHLSRRVSLNLVNYVNSIKYKEEFKPTIELRLPECSLDSADIMNWIRFIVYFTERSLKNPYPADLNPINLEKMYEFMGFHEEISSGLKKTREWIGDRIKKFSDIAFLAKIG